MQPQLQALLFDVDGTLADTEEVHRQAFNAAFADAGLDWVWSHERYHDLLSVTGGKERIRFYLDQDRPVQMNLSPLCTVVKLNTMSACSRKVKCRYVPVLND